MTKRKSSSKKKSARSRNRAAGESPRSPLVTLHGHVHESARLTGTWRCRIGRTHAFTAAHDGPELALVRFDPGDLEAATRELV